ncbi:hypothetical protein JG687_00017767 [Phytophthora cactorum]|uniref:Uncharacterized protein n=1 Tax=Phytophthora cactorum TaxID=29920 RepID=A0A8T1TRM7_9STRA|nr:hypothetical protein JG687_00017767 [Phytophthora cactorum]
MARIKSGYDAIQLHAQAAGPDLNKVKAALLVRTAFHQIQGVAVTPVDLLMGSFYLLFFDGGSRGNLGLEGVVPSWCKSEPHPLTAL